jgi:hypothetical protein
MRIRRPNDTDTGGSRCKSSVCYKGYVHQCCWSLVISRGVCLQLHVRLFYILLDGIQFGSGKHRCLSTRTVTETLHLLIKATDKLYYQCINNIILYYVFSMLNQDLHHWCHNKRTNIKARLLSHNDAHNYKITGILKLLKIPTVAPTCFGSRRNHLQGAILCLAKITVMILYPRRSWRGQCHDSIPGCCAGVRYTARIQQKPRFVLRSVQNTQRKASSM